jgi:hypothetical protein
MKPETFDACFTIGVGPAGEPVERPVRQMDSG